MDTVGPPERDPSWLTRKHVIGSKSARRNRSLALFAVAHGVARTDPAYGLELFQQLPDQMRSNPQWIIRVLAASDPQRAAAFVEAYRWREWSRSEILGRLIRGIAILW